MKRSLLIRYGEIGLKKGNRSFFEECLKQNIRKVLPEDDSIHIRLGRKRLIIDANTSQIESMTSRICQVPGVLSARPAWRFANTWDACIQHWLDLMEPYGQAPQSFAIRAHRSDKRFPMNSQEINQALGELVLEQRPKWTVNLDNPDLTFHVLITNQYIYVSMKDIPGPGGLPVGTAGKLGLLLSGGIDSPVAGYAMQRRGAELIGIYFHSFPYTGDQALNKVKDLRTVLGQFQNTMPLYVVHFTQIQEAIRDACDPKYSVILNRRMMMRLAEHIAQQTGALGLITGESLGQVASQTLENMDNVGAATQFQIYRPLIATDKQDIISIAQKIGTLAISNRPFEDCCTLFVDKHPVIRSHKNKILEEEAKLEIETLVQHAYKATKLL